MYSRNRSSREGEYRYTVPPRYDGNAFAPPVPADDGSTRWEQSADFIRMRSRPPEGYRSNDNIVMHPPKVSEPPAGEKQAELAPDIFAEAAAILAEDDGPAIESGDAVFADHEPHADDAEPAVAMLPEYRDGHGKPHLGFLGDLTSEDMLILGLILIIASDGGESTDKGFLILALAVLFGIRD